MTIGIAYRVPNHGAVLVSDGRVTQDNEIVSDSEKKYVLCGSTACLIAGVVGQVWHKLQEKPPRSFRAFRAALEESDDENDWLAYDKRSDQLWTGAIRIPRAYAALGSGASLALGALDALPAPRTLKEAEKLCMTAVKIACRRNVTCGGRVRVLIVPKRGAILVR